MKWVDFTAVLVVAAGIVVALWWASGRPQGAEATLWREIRSRF